jgi:hypothetical protein
MGLKRGSGTEEFISTGLWASSIGMSAVVLQIPRLKMSDILARLEYCEQKYKDLKSISKDWKLSSHSPVDINSSVPLPLNICHANLPKKMYHNKKWFVLVYCVYCHFQQYFSYIVEC